jgi:hypothetical protein
MGRKHLSSYQSKTEVEPRAGLRAAFNTLVLSKDSESKSALLCHFCRFDLVGEYTARQLTNPTDKLAAIEGLADFLPYNFKAGILFDKYHKLTALTLLWVRSGCQQEVQAGRIPPRPKRPVPTWSWASIDGRISHDLMLPSPSWTLWDSEVVWSIRCMKNEPGKLLIKLRYSVFDFDESRVHFITDVQLEPGSIQSLQCVPILYYKSSDKKKPE